MLAALLLALQAAVAPAPQSAAAPVVTVLRTPGGGIQPEVAVGPTGTLHCVYFTGDARGGDLHYTRSKDGGASFEPAQRVDARDKSALAIGNIRGAHLALGRGERVHIAWMGAAAAMPRCSDGSAPLCYTRNAEDRGFEPVRNLLRTRPGLDGGGSIAADSTGTVVAAWHAPQPGSEDEAGRSVFVSRSIDDGATFGEERPAWSRATGACACCGMRAFSDGDAFFLLYRSATELVHRDVYALSSFDRGATFDGVRVDEWNVAQCMLSNAAFAAAGRRVYAAWETRGQVLFRCVASDGAPATAAIPIAAPGDGGTRKYPAIAVNARGEVLLAWTEGMGWERGGELRWQLYSSDGQSISGASGARDGVPAWSLVAAAALPDGRFVILF